MTASVITKTSALNDVLELLKTNRLPYQDVDLNKGVMISYHDESGKLIGSGGLEFYSNYALLRSVAVDEAQRGKCAGKEIVNDLLNRAKDKTANEVYLLTETAHSYFLKHGFTDIARDQVPDVIKESSEFKSVCPVSAACMVYRFKA